VFEAQLPDDPDGQRHVLFGWALAYSGRFDEAIRQARRGVEMMPLSRDTETGTYLLGVLAKIYVLAGQQEQAIDILGQLVKTPNSNAISPRWLAIDPNFAPLRGNPRFQKLIAAN
jgi:tetratricopeptide (TPR) repeat protein